LFRYPEKKASGEKDFINKNKINNTKLQIFEPIKGDKSTSIIIQYIIRVVPQRVPENV